MFLDLLLDGFGHISFLFIIIVVIIAIIVILDFLASVPFGQIPTNGIAGLEDNCICNFEGC